jgi:hypothetical protein
LAVILVLLGLAVVIYGVVIQVPLLGVAGFVVMLGAAAFGISSFRRGRQPDLKVVGGSSTAGKGSRRAGRGTRRNGIVARLEERWRNRPDQTG